MKLTLEIEMDNAAYEDSDDELPRILRELAKNISANMDALIIASPIKLRDINGNPVGTAVLDGEDCDPPDDDDEHGTPLCDWCGACLADVTCEGPAVEYESLAMSVVLCRSCSDDCEGGEFTLAAVVAKLRDD